MAEDGGLRYRVGFLGAPSSVDGTFHLQVAWDEENLARLKDLGFNTVQSNVAWGPRPGDEPLSLEDVVSLPAAVAQSHPQPVPLRCDPSPERRAARREALWQRIALCRQAGLRTIFHYGAPFNAHARYGDGPPNCISNPREVERNALLLEILAREFPGVDDILLYTYDQDAWLCNEFGPCPRCRGVPLHERLVPFLERLASTWRNSHPQGRLWWEPWELSAGQALRCVQEVKPGGFGLALHSNIAEVQSALPVDRWLKNMCALALRRDIPVIVEHFLGGPSEELEPLLHLSHPLVTLRALKAIAALPGVTGVKEYYGLVPSKEDPNLRMTGLYFANPELGEEEALRELAEPYGTAADDMVCFWEHTSTGMELFPWDTSWFIREAGRSDPGHSLDAAMLRGQQCHTPSWYSTRHAIFMKTDNEQPDPWMLEDVQLRCQLAAESWGTALAIGQGALLRLPDSLVGDLSRNLTDLARLRCRALAYAYHLRETNLVTVLRMLRRDGQPLPERIVAELLDLLAQDAENCRTDRRLATQVSGTAASVEGCEVLSRAAALLARDVDAFLQTYFHEGPDRTSRGVFSVTSR